MCIVNIHCSSLDQTLLAGDRVALANVRQKSVAHFEGA
jgi:hypothetical protein